MTLLDIAMASAGRSVDLTATGALTIEMKTSFMRPGPRDERLIAPGICIHRSTGTAFSPSLNVQKKRPGFIGLSWPRCAWQMHRG
jgi:acyl-coenzyme A thioesterase PaaI-like protein